MRPSVLPFSGQFFRTKRRHHARATHRSILLRTRFNESRAATQPRHTEQHDTSHTAISGRAAKQKVTFCSRSCNTATRPHCWTKVCGTGVTLICRFFWFSRSDQLSRVTTQCFSFAVMSFCVSWSGDMHGHGIFRSAVPTKHFQVQW